MPHEKTEKPYPTIARHVRKLSEVKIRTEGYRAFITTRFQNGPGEGGEDFTIWDRGAEEYWINKL